MTDLDLAAYQECEACRNLFPDAPDGFFVVVSESAGVKHLEEDYGLTSCGLFALGSGWSWPGCPA